ncbi:MAG: M48 family metallopeptidase [Desulfobacterales bacterium]|nr:M48 family metallopeptidase [Desulfobacterales bacterium]
MNFIGIIILLTLLGEFILNTIADMLNLSRLQKQIPEPFKDIYDGEQYRKSQDYLRVNTRFSWISSGVDLALLLIFWFAGGFSLLDNRVRSFDEGPIFTGLMFIAILVALKAVISIPFSVYDIFVIEQRFGFNKTTLGTFVMDHIKGLLIAIIMGVPLIYAILWFFEYAGDIAWLYCWIAVTVYSLFIHYVAPNWIMPLFNKFEVLGDGLLKDAIFDYAESIKFPLENVYVMDGSRRSSKSNAFFTGFGKNRRIVLFDTLISRHTIEELVSVLAHEMGHYKKKHIFKSMILGILQSGIMFYLLSIFISYERLFNAFYIENVSTYAGLVFFGMLYAPMAFFLNLITLAISRKNEYEADQFAVKTTLFREPMVAALKKLSVNNLSNLVPHPFYVFLHYSHPPVLERIKAIDKMT